jgi:hypothetical protein
MNKITFRDVWRDYLSSIKINASLMNFYIADIAYEHLLSHNGYIDEDCNVVCEFPITQEYIERNMIARYENMTLPARVLFFILKGQ